MNSFRADLDFATKNEVRDFVQHFVLSELANSELADSFVFKGGTMLRVCGIKDYRFSEDIDIEAEKSCIPELYSFIDEAVFSLKENSDIYVFLKTDEVSGRYYAECYYKDIAPARMLLDIQDFRSDYEIEIVDKFMFPRYGLDVSGIISCHSFVQVAAAKYNCLANRYKGRDMYDVWHLGQMLDVLEEGWEKAVRTQHEYIKWRTPLTDLHNRLNSKSEYINFLGGWHTDIEEEYMSPPPTFKEAIGLASEVVNKMNEMYFSLDY